MPDVNKTLEQKAYTSTLEVKDADQGLVEAVIATMGVIDKDGDVTEPGFFGTQEDVAILWAHNWGEMPLGKGRIEERGQEAIFSGQFNLATSRGREAFEVLKFQGSSQEWSYGFDIKEGGARFGEFEGEQVRFLMPAADGPGADVHEVSPVIVGAGEGTGTRTVKADGDERQSMVQGLKLHEHIEQIQYELVVLTDRIAEVRQLREQKGKDLGAEAVAALAELKGTIAELEDLGASREKLASQAQIQHAIFESLQNGLNMEAIR